MNHLEFPPPVFCFQAIPSNSILVKFILIFWVQTSILPSSVYTFTQPDSDQRQSFPSSDAPDLWMIITLCGFPLKLISEDLGQGLAT